MEAFILGFWSKMFKPECFEGTKYSIIPNIKTFHIKRDSNEKKNHVLAKEVNANKENLKSKLNLA